MPSVAPVGCDADRMNAGRRNGQVEDAGRMNAGGWMPADECRWMNASRQNANQRNGWDTDRSNDRWVVGQMRNDR